MPSITVIRHAPARANEQGILMGATLDSPLSARGIEIARAKGASLRAAGFSPEKIFTSKLTRARQTADIILKELLLETEVTELEGFNERDFGMHDGKPYRYVIKAFEQYGADPPTVEPVQSFVARVLAGFEQVKTETSESALIVTHSNPVLVMQAAIYKPDKLYDYWNQSDPGHCEGFTYKY